MDYTYPMMKSDSGKINPRTQRAQDALKAAAFKLVSKRPVADISLTEIAEEAGVSRPTVYKLFDDVPTLVAQTSMDYLHETLIRIDEELVADGFDQVGSLDASRESEYFEKLMKRFIEAVYADKEFYYNAVYGPSMSQIMVGFTQILDERMRTHHIGKRFQQKHLDDPDAANDYRAALSAGVVWLVVRWLDSDFAGANSPASISHRIAMTLFDLSDVS